MALGKKYLVVRRDGSIPRWPWFVLAGADPAAPAALRAYADEAERLDMPSVYIREVRALADYYDKYLESHPQGDPGQPDQRNTCEMVNTLMERRL